MFDRRLAPLAFAALLAPFGCQSGDEFEPDNDMDEASDIADGDEQSRSFHVNPDVDYVRFTGEVGFVYTFAADPADADLDTTLTLVDEGGVELAFNDDYEDLGSRLEWTLTDDAPVYLIVDRYEESGLGEYTLTASSATDSDAFEPDNSRAEAGALAAGEVQERSLHSPTDEDWVRVEAPLDSVMLAQAFVSLSASTAPQLELYDQDGGLLAAHAGPATGVGAHLEWRAEAEAYYLRVVAADLGGVVSLGDYQLALTVTDPDTELGVFEPDIYEPDNTPANASRIKAGEPQERTLHLSSDADLIRFEGDRGVTYEITTTIPEGAPTDAFVSILNAEGVIVAEDDDGGPSGDRLLYTPAEDGGLFIRVQPFDSESAGPYVLLLDLP